MPTTTRLAIPYPATTDPPNGPAQMQAIANALDNAAIDLAEGTLAARPAASIRGRWYYATDTGQLFRDSGSTWRQVNVTADLITALEIAPATITNTEISASAAIAESKLNLASDAAPGTASRRTLGTGANQAAAGNDSRFGQASPPTSGSVLLASLAAEVSDRLIPAGTLLPTGRTTAPTGYLLCDGSAVSRTTYSALFTAISTRFGSGDGSTTFNLPDMRGRVAIGLGTHGDVDVIGDNDGVTLANRTPKHYHNTNSQGTHDHTAATGSAGSHSHTIGNAGAHSHTYTYSGNAGGNITYANGGIAHAWTFDSTAGTSGVGDHSHSCSTAAAHTHTISSDGAHTHLAGQDTNRPQDGAAYLVTQYMIKT